MTDKDEDPLTLEELEFFLSDGRIQTDMESRLALQLFDIMQKREHSCTYAFMSDGYAATA